MAVEIHNLQSLLKIDLKLIERAVHVCTEGEPGDLSISIVDDQAIRKIHGEHLGKDRPTDVISFEYGEHGGEVIVSAERALEEARLRGHDPVEELLLYVVHGIMHLRGFDDKEEADAEEMWKAQNRMMKKLGYSGNIGP